MLCRVAPTASRLQRSQTVDSKTNWNTVEIIVKNNTATHIVNGTIVNHVDNVTTKAGVPLTQGKIAFQSEAAEMWFRNIQIKVFK